jgi:hypothetical protein
LCKGVRAFLCIYFVLKPGSYNILVKVGVTALKVSLPGRDCQFFFEKIKVMVKVFPAASPLFM